jgi:hypothetical protein
MKSPVSVSSQVVATVASEGIVDLQKVRAHFDSCQTEPSWHTFGIATGMSGYGSRSRSCIEASTGAMSFDSEAVCREGCASAPRKARSEITRRLKLIKALL